MKLLSAGVLSATLTAGLVGSVAAYRSQVGDGGDAERPTAVAAVAAAAPRADRPEPRVRWAPCPAGSTLERGVCVIDVVHTVVLPAPTPAPSPAPVVAVRDHSGYQDEGDDHGGAREDDADDADHTEDADHEDDEDHEDHEAEGDEDD